MIAVLQVGSQRQVDVDKALDDIEQGTAGGVALNDVEPLARMDSKSSIGPPISSIIISVWLDVEHMNRSPERKRVLARK